MSERDYLVRTRGGSIVHRASCRMVKDQANSTAVRWEWAEKYPALVVEAVRQHNLRVCKLCNPLNRRRRTA